VPKPAEDAPAFSQAAPLSTFEAPAAMKRAVGCTGGGGLTVVVVVVVVVVVPPSTGGVSPVVVSS
jgi:hypothetical protein